MTSGAGIDVIARELSNLAHNDHTFNVSVAGHRTNTAPLPEYYWYQVLSAW
jgi:hypothetical protein